MTAAYTAAAKDGEVEFFRGTRKMGHLVLDSTPHSSGFRQKSTNTEQLSLRRKKCMGPIVRRVCQARLTADRLRKKYMD
jgi:hypothetical protein